MKKYMNSNEMSIKSKVRTHESIFIECMYYSQIEYFIEHDNTNYPASAQLFYAEGVCSGGSLMASAGFDVNTVWAQQFVDSFDYKCLESNMYSTVNPIH